MMCLSPAAAHDGRPALERALHEAAGAPQLAIGDARTLEVVQRIVAQAATVAGELNQSLLPRTTRVDRAAWDGALLRVDLTLDLAGRAPGAPESRAAHADDDWTLSPLDASAISRALGRAFMHDSAFAGVRLRVRRNADQPYGSLEQFVPSAGPPAEAPAEPPAEPARPLDADGGVAVHNFPPPATTRGGPTSAMRRPSGALSGITVFLSAGHGWTAPDAGNWFTQRPVLHDMIEDYGNLDQLNYAVQFAQAAGATVVPLRPVGWQPIEVVLDNDDPGVTYAGTWMDSGESKYYENGATLSGVPYRFANTSPNETATARFTPNIPASDFYPVYCFATASTNRVEQLYRVAHSGGITELTVDHRQVGSGWIYLGEYFFEAGASGYVEISNESATAGVVIADAIRFGCGTGDIVRPGPGTISGYPRDEEAMRYWAHSELGNNAVGFSSSIYDIGGLEDVSDNVGTGARVAREMNQVPPGGVLVDRWKRVHVEMHTNALNGLARGQICLITDTGATTNQPAFAQILSDEIDADLLLLDDDFEHEWVDRAGATLTGSYGAISTGNNGNEFDATLAELAFHDNEEDAQLLRDPRVRRAMGRAVVHGIIRFLNTLPGSQVPLNFAPDTPRKFRVEDLGGGDVRLSWDPPLSDGARGDPATGYVIYQSANGFGFGDPIELGNVTSHTLSNVPAGELRYFRLTATNAGGESMPSEVLAVRRPDSGLATVLIVNGFDRLRRQINPIQQFTQPPAYAGQSIERQQWRRSNAFNYIAEHAEALAAAGVGFASTCNEAIEDLTVDLTDYEIAVWILGTESAEDRTFSAAEQARVNNFTANGGSIFVSGADIAFDLIGQSGGITFAQNTLQIGFSNDDAGTFQVSPAASGIFAGLGAFDFDPDSGAAYEVRQPDRLTAGGAGLACLNYVGGLGGAAAVQFTGPTYNAVTFGFPFETISSPAVRDEIMLRVIDFLANAAGPIAFDWDHDGDVDFNDFNIFAFCLLGPDQDFAGGHTCLTMDGDGDNDVDMSDLALFQAAFTGP